MVNNNPWARAQKQLNNAARHIKLDPLMLAKLTNPDRVIGRILLYRFSLRFKKYGQAWGEEYIF